MQFLSLRALFLLGFVVAMPVLALPPVTRWMDELLYGAPPSDFGQPRAAAAPTGQEMIQPMNAEEVSPANIDQRPFASVGRRGLEAPLAQPPPLAPTPAFAPPVPSQQSAADVEVKIDANTLARLQQVRRRLEELGAEYVIAEALDGSGQFHFHCRMLVDARSRFTRPFEATSADPVVAAEQVLRDVETWRMAAATKSTRQQ